MGGYGDVMLYCFESEDGSHISYARLVDLHLLRELNTIYKSLVEPTKDKDGNIIDEGIGYIHTNPEDGVKFKSINLNNYPNISGNKKLVIKEFGTTKYLNPNTYTFEDYTKHLESNKLNLKW